MRTNISAVADVLKEFATAQQVAVETAQLKELDNLFSEYQVGIESLSSIETELATDAQISDEALMDFFTKVGDTILSLSNTFKTLTLKGGKRSEMRMIYERNTIQINRLESKSIADYVNVNVDVPTGMTGTYPQAVAVITDAYSSLDMLATINNSVKIMDTVLSSMSKGSSTHENEVVTANKLLEGKLKRQEVSMKTLTKVFPDRGVALKKYPIGKMVNSFEELKGVRLALMALEKQLLSTIEINTQMDRMAQSASLASDFIKNTMDGSPESTDYAPSKDFVKLLATFTRNNAIALTNFSEIANAHMATEHNVGLAYTTLLDI